MTWGLTTEAASPNLRFTTCKTQMLTAPAPWSCWMRCSKGCKLLGQVFSTAALSGGESFSMVPPWCPSQCRRLNRTLLNKLKNLIPNSLNLLKQRSQQLWVEPFGFKLPESKLLCHSPTPALGAKVMWRVWYVTA